MNRKIRIGQIGTKHDHASQHFACVSRFPDVFEVVGVVPEDEEQIEKVKTMQDYESCRILTEEQLFNAGCDAIMVEGFELDLPHVAKRCVENGIAVHMDKPAGEDLQAFEDTLRIAKKKGLPVQLGYMYRYNQGFQDCLKLVKEGRLGEIHSVFATMNVMHDLEYWKWLKNFKGGIMFFLGCHMVDFIYQLQGVPNNITPYLKSSGLEGTDSVTLSTAVFEYDHGLSFAQSNSCEVNGYGRRQLVVCGSKGTYELRPLERPVGYLTEMKYAEMFRDKCINREIPTEGFKRYDDMLLDFAAFVRGEKENPYTYEYELQLQKMVLASCGFEVDYQTPIIL